MIIIILVISFIVLISMFLSGFVNIDQLNKKEVETHYAMGKKWKVEKRG